jgi:phage gp36-like protein
MASYASTADFVLAFGKDEAVEITNLDNPTACTVDTAKLQRALDDASSEIDSYLLAASYNLPLSSVPIVLREKTNDIARYRLDKWRNREDVRQRYEDALQWLMNLAKNLASLGADSNGHTVESSIDRPIYYSRGKVYTDDTLLGYDSISRIVGGSRRRF